MGRSRVIHFHPHFIHFRGHSLLSIATTHRALMKTHMEPSPSRNPYSGSILVFWCVFPTELHHGGPSFKTIRLKQRKGCLLLTNQHLSKHFFWVTLKILLVGGSEQGPRVPSPTWKKGTWSTQKVRKCEGDDATFWNLGGCRNCKNFILTLYYELWFQVITPQRGHTPNRWWVFCWSF